MGQKQMTAAGSALRRMVLALLVAALMAAMMVVTAAPAFARGGGGEHAHLITVGQNVGAVVGGGGLGGFGTGVHGGEGCGPVNGCHSGGTI